MTVVQKLIFWLLVLSTFITLSSTVPILAWAALEINSIVFVVLIRDVKKPERYRAAMKYLLIQVYASLFLLLSPLVSDITIVLVLVSMAVKLGISPFHG